MALRIQLLGPLQAWLDGRELDLGGPKQRAVLGLVAACAAGGQALSMPELIDALWPDRPPASAENVIHTYLKRLRRLLEPDRPPRAPSRLLQRVGNGYALTLSSTDLDLARFQRHTRAAADAERAGDQHRAAEQLGEALRLWRGPLLADVPLVAGHPTVVGISSERWAAAGRYGEAMLAIGKAAGALPVLAEAAAANPLDEPAQARLIRSYHAAGRRGQAFATYYTVSRRLADELGVDPGPELVAAHTALLHDDRAHEPRGPAGAARRPAQLPADVTAFVGREHELATLDALLDPPGEAAGEAAGEPAPATPMICAVTGTAGVGKTALAVRAAHRARARFPDGQLYLDLRGYGPEPPVTPAEALARLLRAVGEPDAGIPLDLDERAARYRTLLDGQRLLIVLDNAASTEQIRALLPGTPTCMVLVTSRDLLAGLVAAYGAHRLDLDLLPRAEATELLRRTIGARVDAEPVAAATLAEQCARLPLGLRVAAELVISRPTARLAELTTELADQQRRLEVLDAGGEPRATLAAVFSWSVQHLPPYAARTFRLLGLHPGQDWDAGAAGALASDDDARRALDLLGRAHLVHPTATGRYGMHDLLRGYAAGLALTGDTEAGRWAAVGRLLDYYLAAAAAAMDLLYPAEKHRRPRVPPPATPLPELADETAARAWLDAERANLVALVAYTADHGWPAHTVRLATTLIRYLDGSHGIDALAVHGHAYRAARDAGDWAEEARALSNFGNAYLMLGDYETAAEHIGQALLLCQQIGDPIGEARARTSLGMVGWRQGHYPLAAEHLERAMALYGQAGDRGGEANALTNLGVVERRLGRHEMAAEHHRQALALYRRLGDRTGQARALDNLGLVEQQLGLAESAAAHHAQALALYRDLGNQHGIGHALDNLGQVHTRLGQPEQAAEHHRNALTLFRGIGDRDGQAWALNGLGRAARFAGNPAEAIAHHGDALSIAGEIGARDLQASAHNGLGEALYAAGLIAEARSHHALARELAVALGDPSEQARANAGLV